MQGHHLIALFVAAALIAGCKTAPPKPASVPAVATETTVEGTVVGDQKTAMEAAVEAASSNSVQTSEAPAKGVPLAPNAPDSYVVKRGDTLWALPRSFCAILGIGRKSGRSIRRFITRT